MFVNYITLCITSGITLVGYECISPRTVNLRLKLVTYIVTITCIYTRVAGKTSETEEFYNDL
jgi:hypothetical protein